MIKQKLAKQEDPDLPQFRQNVFMNVSRRLEGGKNEPNTNNWLFLPFQIIGRIQSLAEPSIAKKGSQYIEWGPAFFFS